MILRGLFWIAGTEEGIIFKYVCLHRHVGISLTPSQSHLLIKYNSLLLIYATAATVNAAALSLNMECRPISFYTLIYIYMYKYKYDLSDFFI